MNCFKVMLECKDLLIRLENSNEPQLLGCFCTRYLEGIDINDAIFSAKKMVQAELIEQDIICALEQVSVESVEEINVIPDDVANSGFTFFVG